MAGMSSIVIAHCCVRYCDKYIVFGLLPGCVVGNTVVFFIFSAQSHTFGPAPAPAVGLCYGPELLLYNSICYFFFCFSSFALIHSYIGLALVRMKFSTWTACEPEREKMSRKNKRKTANNPSPANTLFVCVYSRYFEESE